MQGSLGLLLGPVATFSIFRITSKPSPITLWKGGRSQGAASNKKKAAHMHPAEANHIRAAPASPHCQEKPRRTPKTTCLLSNHSVLANVIKNWHPFEFGPLFAWRKRATTRERIHDQAKRMEGERNGIRLSSRATNHGQQPGARVLPDEVLVGRFGPVNAHAARAIPLRTGNKSGKKPVTQQQRSAGGQRPRGGPEKEPTRGSP